MKSKLNEVIPNLIESIKSDKMITLDSIYDWMQSNTDSVIRVGSRIKLNGIKTTGAAGSNYYSSCIEIYECADGYLGVEALCWIDKGLDPDEYKDFVPKVFEVTLVFTNIKEC